MQMSSEVTRKSQTRWRSTDFPKTAKGLKHMTKSAPCALTQPPRQNSTRGGRCNGGSRRSKIVYVTIENTVKDVTLSQIGWDSHEGGLVDDRQWSIRQRLPQVVWRIRSGAIQRFSPTQRRGRKNTPRLRKATNLVGNWKSAETI